MFEELLSWKKKLSIGAERAQALHTTVINNLPRTIKHIAFVGMGGSGVAGRIVKTIFDKKTPLWSTIVDGPEIPACVNQQTLAIVISFSGNTWETIEALNTLIAKKIPTIIVSHGGKAQEIAHRKSIPLCVMPECSAPRAALGYFLGFLLEFFDLSGVVHGKSILNEFHVSLDRFLPQLQDQETYNEFLALVQKRDFFHIWGIAQDTASVAYRAQTQFNENSKVQAICSSYPELNHNLLEGIARCASLPLVLLFSTNLHEISLQASIAAVEDFLDKKRILLYKSPILGDNWEQRLFSMIIWADFASYYLGKMRGVDIASVDAINQLKEGYQGKLLDLKNN